MSMKNTNFWEINLAQERRIKEKWGDATIIQHGSLYNLTESGNQSLCQPEAEDQLRACHQQLGGETLEEAGRALVLEHLGDNLEARLGVFEVAVLDTGLDNIEGSRHNQGCASTTDRGDEVLAPGSLVVIGQFVNFFLGESRSAEELLSS